MDDRVLNMTYESLATGSLKCCIGYDMKSSKMIVWFDKMLFIHEFT